MKTKKKLTGLLDTEPKSLNRFIVHFPQKYGIESWQVKSIDKPKYCGTSLDGDDWDTITIRFHDTIGYSTSKSLYKILEDALENFSSSIFDIKIESLSSVDIVIETWVISVEKIISIDFGTLDYSNNLPQCIHMVIKPLTCILE